MGRNLCFNFLDRDIVLSAYNRNDPNEIKIIEQFRSETRDKKCKCFTDLSAFIASLERPRKILLMVKAGKATDDLIAQLMPNLEAGDIIIDGGNSHYQETERRQELCLNGMVEFIGCGISGGEKGARFGPSIMPGGSLDAYLNVRTYLDKIAARDKLDKSCSVYIGPGGSGHFVKMVHNGIEYVEMQLLSECYDLLHSRFEVSEIADIFRDWNKGECSSYLLEITISILEKKEGDVFLIEKILDKAGNKGTGSWSSIASLQLGSVNNMMCSAVNARYISSFKSTRIRFNERKLNKSEGVDNKLLKLLREAYQSARRINHHQGFQLLKMASDQYNWNLSLTEIARIWTNGCIIRSDLMEECVNTLKYSESLLDDVVFYKSVLNANDQLTNITSHAILKAIPVPCLSAAANYWIAINRANLPANLIQAQRDYFGAHTYQRTDDNSGKYYHTNWD